MSSRPLQLEDFERMLREHMDDLMGGQKLRRNRNTSTTGSDTTPSNVKSFLKAASGGDRRRCQSFLEGGGSPNARGQKGIAALHLAAHENQLAIIKELLKAGADINATDEDGDTPLICAVINRKEEAVVLLIDRGANLRHVNNKGHTAADVALMKRSLSIVSTLENVTRCLQFDSVVHEKTLMTAAQEGNTRVIDFWLKNHPDRRACNHQLGQKRTMAFVAALNGHLDVIQLLDKKGADLELTDDRGHTPLFCAAQNDHYEIVQYLVNVKRCNVNHESITGRTPIFNAVSNGHDDIVRFLIRNGANVNHADEEGTTPLECAIKQGSMTIFHLLIDEGARLDHVEYNGYDFAMICASNQQLDMLKELHVLGVPTNQVNKKNGETALLGACQVGPEESVAFLISNGSDMDHQNKRGVSPALRAAYNGHFIILMALGESGAKMDLPNRINETAMLCAAQKGSVDMVKYLHSKRCNIAVKDDNGKTLAWYAAKDDNLELLEYLREIGAPLDIQDKDGNTPLMRAVRADASPETVRYLVQADCSLQKRNKKGENAEDIARSRKREELLKILRRQRLGGRQDDDQAAKRNDQKRAQKPRRDAMEESAGAAAADGSGVSSGLDPSFNTWDFIFDDGDKKKPIGEGGFGKVYKAYTDKHQFVAVKIVKLRGADPRKLEKIIEQERKGMEMLKTIRHKNIVVFLKSERTRDGQFCIFTELIAGISLSDLMNRQRKPFDESGVKKFSLQICSALNFLHRRRPAILHRDIKCSNIMLTHEGIIKLIDFGLAKEIVTTTIVYTSLHQCGTSYYMAPELFSEDGHASYTPQSDVWAFGCSVFEMATKHPPNRRLQPMQLPMFLRTKEMPPLGDNFSANLRDFYRCCVIKDPDERMDTTDLLDHAFLARN